MFSNCEWVRLWQDIGKDSQEVGTQKPDKNFTPQPGQSVTYALKHPPFHFSVSAGAIWLKAEGLVGTTAVATNEWKQFGTPKRLVLEADCPVITADGADLSRSIVTAVDAEGMSVDTCNAPVTFSVEGLGQLIGENPAKLRAGKMIILAQSAFTPGEMTVSAAAEGLSPASVVVKTKPVPVNVNIPKNLPARQPTPRTPLVDRNAPHRK